MTTPQNRTSPTGAATIAGIFAVLVIVLAFVSTGKIERAIPMAMLGLQLLGATLIIVGVLELMGFAKSRAQRTLVDHLAPLTIIVVGISLTTSGWIAPLALALIWTVAIYKGRSLEGPATTEND